MDREKRKREGGGCSGGCGSSSAAGLRRLTGCMCRASDALVFSLSLPETGSSFRAYFILIFLSLSLPSSPCVRLCRQTRCRADRHMKSAKYVSPDRRQSRVLLSHSPVLVVEKLLLPASGSPVQLVPNDSLSLSLSCLDSHANDDLILFTSSSALFQIRLRISPPFLVYAVSLSLPPVCSCCLCRLSDCLCRPLVCLSPSARLSDSRAAASSVLLSHRLSLIVGLITAAAAELLPGSCVRRMQVPRAG